MSDWNGVDNEKEWEEVTLRRLKATDSSRWNVAANRYGRTFTTFRLFGF
jgi:hypothetical protein